MSGTSLEAKDRRRALVALLLLAPIPSLGVTAAMVVSPGLVGQTIFLTAKMWLLFFPAFWYLVIEGGTPSWSPPRRGGLGVGLVSGLAAAGVIGLAAIAVGVFRTDMSALSIELDTMGLAQPSAYLLAALGWTVVNSLVEEYVYRWFILGQCKRLLPPAAAIVASAVIFTAHHVIALSTYLPGHLTAIGSLGVFLGGVLWAALYGRYRSIWPGWLSHVIADAAIFAIGWGLLFG